MFVFFFKQKTAYEIRISDWSSDVCSSDLKSPAPSRYGASRGGDPRTAHRSCPGLDDVFSAERPLAARDLAAELRDESLETLVAGRKRGGVGFGKRCGDGELVADEQRQRFEHHLQVAATRRHLARYAVEPDLPKIIDLLARAPSAQ